MSRFEREWLDDKDEVISHITSPPRRLYWHSLMRSEAEKIEEQISAESAGPQFLQLNDHFQCTIPSFYTHYFLHYSTYATYRFLRLDCGKGSGFVGTFETFLWCHHPITIVLTFSCGSGEFSHVHVHKWMAFSRHYRPPWNQEVDVSVDSQWFTVTSNGSSNNWSCSLQNILLLSRKRDRHNPNESIKVL